MGAWEDQLDGRAVPDVGGRDVVRNPSTAEEQLLAELALKREVRLTDPETGGQKGQKLAQLSCLPPNALLRVAEVAGFGAEKYERNNYRRGYDWHLSLDACERHLLLFWNGEDTDPESGLSHVAHAAWHLLALLDFIERLPEKDDRFKGRS